MTDPSLPDISPTVAIRRELSAFWARVTLICGCKPRELRVDSGIRCARCGSLVGISARQ